MDKDQRTPKQRDQDLRKRSSDMIALANGLNAKMGDDCALVSAVVALALEQRRTADLLDCILSELRGMNDGGLRR